MDLLAQVSRDQLAIIPWAAAIGFALVVGIWRPRNFHWTALASVLLFAALSAGASIYVLKHFSDLRWSIGKEPALSAPSFSGTPVVGQFLSPLDSALDDVVGGVNEFLAFKNALPVALDFMAASGWALLLSFPLAVLAAGLSFAASRRRRADFDRYRATVDSLKDELDQIKRQLSPRDFSYVALPGDEGLTNIRS